MTEHQIVPTMAFLNINGPHKKLPPREHSIAYAMKKAPKLALIEQLIADLPLDRKSKLDAVTACETFYRHWLVSQRTSGRSTACPLWVVFVAEALGLREIRIEPDGIAADGKRFKIIHRAGGSV